MNMTVTIHTYGNKAEKVSISSLNEASQKWCAFRDENFISASVMMGNCGKVHTNGKLTHIVSYNGRVWTWHKDWEKRQEVTTF